MGEFMTTLTTAVTGAKLWEAIAPAAPIIGVGILFSIGYMVLRRAITGIGRGKAKV